MEQNFLVHWGKSRRNQGNVREISSLHLALNDQEEQMALAKSYRNGPAIAPFLGRLLYLSGGQCKSYAPF